MLTTLAEDTAIPCLNKEANLCRITLLGQNGISPPDDTNKKAPSNKLPEAEDYRIRAST